MDPLYTELDWLPRAPHDISAMPKSLAGDKETTGNELRAFALHGLDSLILQVDNPELNVDSAAQECATMKVLTRRCNPIAGVLWHD